MERIDYKRLDKINIGHNVTEAFDLHEIVKTLLMRMERRAHPSKTNSPIYSEYHPVYPNKYYPDIYLGGKNKIVWEIQEQITKQWLATQEDRELNVEGYGNIMIVRLKKIREEFQKRTGTDLDDVLSVLREVLEAYKI